MRAEYRRTIAALPDDLAALHGELANFLEAAALAPRTIHAVQLVCDELLGNAVRHGARGRDGSAYRLELAVVIGDRIDVRIRDDLPLFDPTLVPAPARAASLAAAPVGGRGLALVRRYSRDFRWHAEKGRNVVDAVIARIEPGARGERDERDARPRE